ncbi:DUF2975 domain-containing protein [Eubacteriales bacterium OttesenSCG-928-G02]|nr:DUF2975 domain-containing protein [Eubacteriales bacterium OttesenSCG-928-G02]
MGLFKKTDNFLGRYKSIVPITKFLAPVFNALFYIILVLVALIVIVTIIVFLANVDVDKMLLPPDMDAIKENGIIKFYSLKLGNGIKIISEASTITLSHIKLVIYSKLAVWGLNLLIMAPIFKFLSKLFKNVSKNEVLNEQNAISINYVGMIILIGNTISNILKNAMNYLQVNKFMSVAAENIEYLFDIELFGIVMGIFIITVGTIYGYACSIASNTSESRNVIQAEDRE